MPGLLDMGERKFYRFVISAEHDSSTHVLHRANPARHHHIILPHRNLTEVTRWSKIYSQEVNFTE